MQVLLTGAAGFIGFHVAQQLLAAGHHVLGVDNFNSYYCVDLKRARHAQLQQHKNFSSVTLDLHDAAAVSELFAHRHFDQVVHLAAQAGVRYSLQNPQAYIDANIVGFVNVLEHVRHQQVPRLIYASSSSVYAGMTELPYHEQQRCDQPMSLYAATKRANELMAHTYSHLFDMQTIGLRFFTVYGPWGRPDMAMWIFAERILDGKAIPVFNHGKMQRDFTYIDDIVQGVIALMQAPELPRCDVYNIGNHKAEQLSDMIALLETALGCKAEQELLPMQPGDVPATYADISKIQNLVNFAPRTSLRDGVPRFVEWYMAHPELAAAVRKSRL